MSSDVGTDPTDSAVVVESEHEILATAMVATFARAWSTADVEDRSPAP